jgi:hypothetical protein
MPDDSIRIGSVWKPAGSRDRWLPHALLNHVVLAAPPETMILPLSKMAGNVLANRWDAQAPA